MERTRLDKVKLSRKEKLMNQVADFEMLIKTLENGVAQIKKDSEDLIKQINNGRKNERRNQIGVKRK